LEVINWLCNVYLKMLECLHELSLTGDVFKDTDAFLFCLYYVTPCCWLALIMRIIILMYNVLSFFRFSYLRQYLWCISKMLTGFSLMSIIERPHSFYHAISFFFSPNFKKYKFWYQMAMLHVWLPIIRGVPWEWLVEGNCCFIYTFPS